MKKCAKCLLEFSLENFSNNKSHKDGKCSYCKKCKAKVQRAYQRKNPEVFAEAQRRWIKENPEKWRAFQRPHARRWAKKNYHSDPEQGRKKGRDQYHTGKENLSDGYINAKIVNSSNRFLKAADIPPWLRSLKRVELEIGRAIEQLIDAGK